MNDRPTQNLSVLRRELKFYLSYADYLHLKSLLSCVLSRDAHAEKQSDYFIRSLYFDSFDNVDYHEKIAGLNRRKKIRLRIYDPMQDWAKLEIKNKWGNFSYKESAMVDEKMACALAEQNFDVLRSNDNAILQKTHRIFSLGQYRPVVIVDYEREAYTYPENNVRITFDKNIRGAKSIDMFSQDLPTVPVLKENTVVLEVKYTGNLPETIKHLLSAVDAVPSSISKYCLSREILY